MTSEGGRPKIEESETYIALQCSVRALHLDAQYARRVRLTLISNVVPECSSCIIETETV